MLRTGKDGNRWIGGGAFVSLEPPSLVLLLKCRKWCEMGQCGPLGPLEVMVTRLSTTQAQEAEKSLLLGDPIL